MADTSSRNSGARRRLYGSKPSHGVVAEQLAHTYAQILAETKRTLLQYVSRDRAVIDILRLEQGNRSFHEFLAEIEDQEYLCRTDEMLITSKDLKRMALIAGMRDRTLAEKLLAEKYTLDQEIQTGVTRETSKSNAEAMQPRITKGVQWVDEEKPDLESRVAMLQKEMEEVKLIRKHGKYSTRYKPPDSSQATCPACTMRRGDTCPAADRVCNTCGKKVTFNVRSTVKRIVRKQTLLRESYMNVATVIALKMNITYLAFSLSPQHRTGPESTLMRKPPRPFILCVRQERGGLSGS